MRIGAALSCLVLSMCAWAQQIPFDPVAYDSERDAYYIANELVIGLEPSALLMQQAMAWVGQLRDWQSPLQAGVVRLDADLDPDAVRTFLLALPGVRYVERNYLAFVCSAPNDPLFGSQWGLMRIQAPQAWAQWQPQRTVYLAIVDTGVDSGHPDLLHKMRRYSNGAVYGYNALFNNANANDGHGHGTHCAGIAAAHTHNGVGIAGVAAWNASFASSHTAAQIMPVKVLNDQGYGSFADVARGIIWAADNGAHIISLSLGGTVGTQLLHDAVDYAWNRGSLVVAAAGNNGSNTPFYPAFYENVIAVAATDSADRLTEFSQFGAWVDIAAPGDEIVSTVPGGGYESWSGTSMACPHVAGAAALIWSRTPSLTNQQLRQVLENHADPCQPYWFGGIGEGKGRLNVRRALQAALQLENTPVLSGLSLSASSVQAGGAVQGTVTLTRPASTGGFVVNLQSSNSNLAWCAGSITIPQGQSSGVFTISTASTGAGSVTITASAGGVARSAALQVVSPYQIQAISLASGSVTGGQSTVLTVHISAPAPTGGVSVQLRSSDPLRALLPATVRVPAGQSRVSVQVTTFPVSSRMQAQLTASLNSSQASATLTINPPAPSTLVISPASVLGGRSTTATVSLNAPAPPEGLWLRVRNDQLSRVWTPPVVYVRPSDRSAQFTILTYPGRRAVNATITVSTDSGSRSAMLEVR